MSTAKDIFKKHQAQTFPFPSCLEVESAKGSYITDVKGKAYLDFIAGVSSCTLGHSNPIIINAVKEQLDKYTHVMVYGEYIQSPQYKLAELLANNLPESLSTTYFTNSGAEAIEGAMKLAKRATGRSEIISCQNAYHGSTQGSLSIMGNEEHKTKYRPLLPNCNQIIYNDKSSLKNITKQTAAVVIELIQGATGFITPKNNFLQQVREKCTETGALLIFDEIQTGFRWSLGGAQEFFDVTADFSAWGKAMGNGMPLGSISGKSEFMEVFEDVFYSTTFGGETLSLAAFNATVLELQNKKALDVIHEKGKNFQKEFKSRSNEIGLEIPVDGHPAKIRLQFLDENNDESLIIRSLFCQENIQNGIFFWQGPIFHTYSHSDDDFEKTINSVEDSLKTLKHAIDNKEVEHKLKGKSMNRVLKFPKN